MYFIFVDNHIFFVKIILIVIKKDNLGPIENGGTNKGRNTMNHVLIL